MSTKKAMINQNFKDKIRTESKTENAEEIIKNIAGREPARNRAKAAAAAAKGKAAKQPTGTAPRAARGNAAPEQQPEPEQTTIEQLTAEREKAEKAAAAAAAKAKETAAAARAAEQKAARAKAIEQLQKISFVADYSKPVEQLRDKYIIPEKSRSTPKNKRVQLLLHDDLFECVQAAATITGCSVNEIFTAAVYELCLDLNSKMEN